MQEYCQLCQCWLPTRICGSLRGPFTCYLACVYILVISLPSRSSVHEVLHEVLAPGCKNEASCVRPAGCRRRVSADAAQERCRRDPWRVSGGWCCTQGCRAHQGGFGRLPRRRHRQLRRRRRRAPELLLLLVPGQLLLSAAASEPTRGLQQHAAAATTNTLPPRAQTTSRTSSRSRTRAAPRASP